MALLPIIYLSILITSGLILVVVTVSFVSSKLRNRGNGDRILAISNAGVNTGNTIIEQPKVVIQTRNVKRVNQPIPQPVREHGVNHNYETRVDDRPRVTRVFTQEHSRNEQKHSQTYKANLINSATSEYRSSRQKHNTRIEVVNNMSQKGSGEFNLQTANSNAPLYYYSHNNDQTFYTIKAS